jgi:ubiquinone/menaquinone biosynthesis C-methylase UbiE
MDVNGEKIERAAKGTPAALRSKVEFVLADVSTVELPAEAYDVAILSHSL